MGCGASSVSNEVIQTTKYQRDQHTSPTQNNSSAQKLSPHTPSVNSSNVLKSSFLPQLDVNPVNRSSEHPPLQNYTVETSSSNKNLPSNKELDITLRSHSIAYSTTNSFVEFTKKQKCEKPTLPPTKEIEHAKEVNIVQGAWHEDTDGTFDSGFTVEVGVVGAPAKFENDKDS